MEISIYQVHNIIARYLSLRHCVYFMSDWLVFFCSFLCCQCTEYWVQDSPTESLSDVSIATYEMIRRKDKVDTGLLGEPSKSQGIMIDFEKKEPKCSIQKCTELWSHVDDGQKELDGAILESNFKPTTLDKLTKSPTTSKKQFINECREEYPAVHNAIKQPEQHRVASESFTV